MATEPKAPVSNKVPSKRKFPTTAVVWGGVLGVGSVLFLTWWYSQGNRRGPLPGNSTTTKRINAPKTGSSNALARQVAQQRNGIVVRFLVGSNFRNSTSSIQPDVAFVSAPNGWTQRVGGPTTDQFNLTLADTILSHLQPGMQVYLQDTRDSRGNPVWADTSKAELVKQLVRWSGLPNERFEWIQ